MLPLMLALVVLQSGAAAKAPIPRFHQVDERLYRGAQPDAAGFRFLRDMGVRTIVNLREEEDAVRIGEQKLVESLGMRYIALPIRDATLFNASRRIPEERLRAFLQLMDVETGPVFVHCRRGTDRTGAMVAFYRIARYRWDAARAYAEARSVGMRRWYTGLKRQILEFSPEAADAIVRAREHDGR